KLTTAVDVNVVEVSPTIYSSCIEQFWATAKVKHVNEEAQLHAKVDGKRVVISEASIKSDLRFRDKGATEETEDKKTKDIELPQTSVPTEVVTYEAVYEEMYDSVEMAATIVTGLDAEQYRGIISKTQFTTTLDEPSSIRTSSGSGPKRQKTMRDAAAQTRSERVSKFFNDPPLSRVNTLRSGEDRMKLVELMELWRNDQDMFDTCVLDDEEVVAEKKVSTVDPVTTVGEVVTIAGVEVSTAAATPIISMNDITLAKALAALKSAKPMVKEPNHELAERLQVEEQRELTIEEMSKLFVKLMNERKKHFARHRAEEKRRKPPHQSSKEETNVAKGSETRAEGSSKRVGEELKSDKSKKQKLDEHVKVKEDNNQEEAEMKMYMKIISDDEIALDAIPLATKPPIIFDWKIIKEGKISFYHIIRHDGSSKRPEKAYERVLWGDLKVMFEPDIEKKGYSFTPATITEMLNRELQVDHWNEICYQLLKLMLKHQKKK
nr:hypothetical protein [Tanacetum cinerariifolium]